MLRWFCLFLLIAPAGLQGFAQDSTHTRNRLALGLAYTSGPRAYGSKGFFGPQASYTFGKGKWEASAFIGGYYSYNEDGSQTKFVGGTLTPGISDPVWIEYTKIKAYTAKIGLIRLFPTGKKFTAGLGLNFGYSNIQRPSHFDTKPGIVTNPTDQYYGRYFFNRQFEMNRASYYLLLPVVKLNWTLSKILSVFMSTEAGMIWEKRKYSHNGELYILKEAYNPFQPDGSYDPFKNFNNDMIEKTLYGSTNTPKYTLRKFDFIGIFNVNFGLSLLINP